jgi:hypothetical protein
VVVITLAGFGGIVLFVTAELLSGIGDRCYPEVPAIHQHGFGVLFIGRCNWRSLHYAASRGTGAQRISYHTELAVSPHSPFRRERRMRMAEATKFDRKSGGAEWRGLRFLSKPDME